MIQVCLLAKMSVCWRRPRAWTGTLRSSDQASTAATRTNGTQIHAAFWYQTSLVAPVSAFVNTWAAPIRLNPTTHGVTNWTTLTPKLPMPAWTPRAVPCLALGKKYEVLGMNPLNTPPPIPAMIASSRRVT